MQNKDNSSARGLWQGIRAFLAKAPMLGWLLGVIVAVFLEQYFGTQLAKGLGLPKIPVLFGFVIMLKTPLMIPSVFAYDLLIFFIPIIGVARITASITNQLAAALDRMPLIISAVLHLILLYIALHTWSEVSDYRNLTLRLTLIAVLLTLSLNIINGYMGEFSCSHPGFMALGAYMGSVFTVLLFAKDKLFGPALLPPELGPYLFPLGLIIAGLTASVGALAIAVPSFRTRGDYLAIISLAFMFIVKSLIENLEVVGGPRGLSGQPNWANLPTVFLVTIIGVWMINNFVTSILGKALNAVRDDEMAADAMTVDTRKTKIVAFMFAAFWAGVAGALFAHVLRYVNPGTFGIQKLAEVLAMVYFGGLNSVYGSIVGAVGIQIMGEALRPLELFKWILIPTLLILVMIYRPTGLIAFKEFNLKRILAPRK
ncbi:branched-chain amino acid ABC transporter permease [Dethiosulfatarculus sandiegensis]|uniref:branched-chain amino acid ABC transporter permease n=1 Tax=Dethiosulfatarculus sandiegensis TaxID=1429043 RepID=UPI000A572ACA|nr:branched-chain amino acid ABC transporter permease [Dethiosulfatarculus sandiegensis]